MDLSKLYVSGVSDLNKMAASVLKIHFRNVSSKDISYKDLKKFERERFIAPYNHENNMEDVDIFFQVYQDVLNTHVSRKKKCMRGDAKSFIKKKL